MGFRALFYIEQNYAYAILRPLQREILAHGGAVAWLLVGHEIDPALLAGDELALRDAGAAIGFNPDVVVAPGDRVPSFIPGLKVQVFHGLNEDKRGNVYPERGLFDLYCTEGPGRTAMLQPLANQRGYFRVRETGWLKLDSLFGFSASDRDSNSDIEDQRVAEQGPEARPQILFASTFTPRLSCAEHVYEAIQKLASTGRWQWLVTMHPKMAPATVAKYRSLQSESLSFGNADQVIELLHRADVMVCDNSSILQEFLLLQKPVVTFNNRDPHPCMINIDDPAELQTAIERALQPDPQRMQAIAEYGASITPFLDGKSAGRVYQAVMELLGSGWRDTKPRNRWRNWKMRRQHNYYKFW